ncbi:MAG: hypothetical protein AVDCRST_MAG25-84, partial [uncultured Rubrobacteraceae bacterium]
DPGLLLHPGSRRLRRLLRRRYPRAGRLRGGRRCPLRGFGREPRRDRRGARGPGADRGTAAHARRGSHRQGGTGERTRRDTGGWCAAERREAQV